MNTKVHQILAVIMAFFVLASTLSWTVEKHYCMGHMVDFSLFGTASSCDMSTGNEESDTPSSLDSCCEDELIVVDGQDDLNMSYSDLKVKEVSYLLAFTFVRFLPTPKEDKKERFFHTKPPPLLVRDIQLLDQVFLI